MLSSTASGGSTTIVTVTGNTTTTTTTDPYETIGVVAFLMSLAGACAALAVLVLVVTLAYRYKEYQLLDFQYPKDEDFAYLLISDALNRRYLFIYDLIIKLNDNRGSFSY